MLAQNYWWDGMYSDVTRFSKICLTCVDYHGSGQKVWPSLQPHPVGGLIERISVDILEMPLNLRGNRHVVCLVTTCQNG